MKKRYIKSGSICKVTFTVPKEIGADAEKAVVVGDFNNWDSSANPMKKYKNGQFKLTLDLVSGKEYKFKYLLDENSWENDWDADKYVSNDYGTDDSVVVV